MITVQYFDPDDSKNTKHISTNSEDAVGVLTTLLEALGYVIVSIDRESEEEKNEE